MRQVTLTIICIFIVPFLFSSSNAVKVPVDRTINLQVMDRPYLEFEQKEIRQQPSRSKVQGIVDTLYWYESEYPWGLWPSLDTFTQSGDTIMTWFCPIAECSLLAVECKWHTGGTVELHVWDDTTLDGRLGHLDKNLIPPTEWLVEGDDYNWQTFDLKQQGLSCVLPYNPEDGYFFYVGFVLQGSGIGVDPQICWEEPWDHSLESRCSGRYGHWRVHLQPPVVLTPGWAYLSWEGNPHLNTELLLRVIVKYNSTPPTITNMTQLCDTYNKAGPFKVMATIEDLDGTVEAAYLRYTSTLSGISDSAEMSLNPVHANKCTAETFIKGSFQTGDTVIYDIKAIDNDYNSGFSEVRHFVICEPQNPAAEILLVNDDGGNRDWFYEAILSSQIIGKEYEVWRIDEHRGIDSSVTNYGWPTIIWFGYAAADIPVKDYTNSPIASFLKNGNSLFLTSPDYFFQISQGELNVNINFEPGDFAYDYLGIASCVSDPASDNLSSGDTAFIGVSGDTISNDWVGKALVINNSNWGLPNWADYVQARASATSIFYGATSGACCGVRYEGPDFKTVFIPWIYEAIVSYDDAVTFMRNILSWFGQIKGVEEASTPNLMYRLYQNSPNPFSNITRICYEIPIKSRVSLEVFDVTGRVLRTFNFVEQKPGKHIFSLNASELTSGVYFYSIEAGNFKAIRKMLIIK